MRRMLDHLGRACRNARHAAELKQIDIATRAGVSDSVISRFENGQAWPEHPDVIVDAYARETGTTARQLWEAALDDWR